MNKKVEVTELAKRPMTVAHVHESGPHAWCASKSTSDGYQYASTGATREDAVDTLTTFLMETLERYEKALCEVASSRGNWPTCANIADEALGSTFKNGERVTPRARDGGWGAK